MDGSLVKIKGGGETGSMCLLSYQVRWYVHWYVHVPRSVQRYVHVPNRPRYEHAPLYRNSSVLNRPWYVHISMNVVRAGMLG